MSNLLPCLSGAVSLVLALLSSHLCCNSFPIVLSSPVAVFPVAISRTCLIMQTDTSKNGYRISLPFTPFSSETKTGTNQAVSVSLFSYSRREGFCSPSPLIEAQGLERCGKLDCLLMLR